ncbi:alpha-glucuronidase [Altererythrobacter atlanticus]|nr:alpha-glucuronidase [Croceibacterium atlanticum]
MRGRELVNRMLQALLVLLAVALPAATARAEDGYRLWLRYAPLEGPALADLTRRPLAVQIPVGGAIPDNPTIRAAADELQKGLSSLSGRQVSLMKGHDAETRADHAIIRLHCARSEIAAGGAFSIRQSSRGLDILASEPIGCLYGSFSLLRALSEGMRLSDIGRSEAPRYPLRMLNHWDNPDGSVERGYAGSSIFDWWKLPDHLDQWMIDYARANASIGINGVVVNNVNASAMMLEPRYIARLKRLADAWRPYGIRVYLSARFSAPRDIGGLETADPFDPRVAAWWKDKADEIYAAIPDFGGFLVKANSEGQPGPGDYGRTHADGANMLAHALGPRGTVIWRAFVYSEHDEADRARQAFAEFAPLDGQFADNVILQVKNGPIDFQPREPFHPLFGAMPDTRVMLETQITKEYLGFSTHLAFLAPMWKEVLDAPTGHGKTVAEAIAPAGMAGVANIGSDRNWSGSHFDQANWYAFGRLAWDPSLSAEQLAREWAAQTWSREEGFVADISAMMLGSREIVADYMTPLGLAHLMATGHHYGPAPWVCDLPRPEWNPCYYHRADRQGIGFDRTPGGSNALADYAPIAAARWADPDRMDSRYLLWFHHLPWDWTFPDGTSLWQTLVQRYDAGVAGVAQMQQVWAGHEGEIDARRHADVADFLKIQRREAQWWRDASIAYWQSLNSLPLPDGTRPPARSLGHYRALSFPEAPGN